MDKPISVGDLVQVVRPSFCCGSLTELGKTFRVEELQEARWTYCTECNARGLPGGVIARGTSPYVSFINTRLKPIPPLEELESTRTEETLKEPA